MIIKEIEDIMKNIQYLWIGKFSDEYLNLLYNYWHLLESYEERLITIQGMSLEEILYSKYYWFSRMTERFHEVYGVDAGIDQQQFMLMEELEQRLEKVDWQLVEELHNGKKA